MSARYLYKSLQYLDVINTVANYSRAKKKKKKRKRVEAPLSRVLQMCSL